jgi:hypothetical protein
MGFEHFHPNARVRRAFDRAHELRLAYLRDLLARLMRPLSAWQQAPSLAAPRGAQPLTATLTGAGRRHAWRPRGYPRFDGDDAPAVGGGTGFLWDPAGIPIKARPGERDARHPARPS